jgi:hypothetical protein
VGCEFGRGANCVAGTVGGQNTGGGGGGGGASSDEANIDCIDGYGGSGRVIVWCDKYIVTVIQHYLLSDLSSTSLSVKYSNYYKPAIKFNTSWVPNTTGSYYSSTTSNYVEIHGLLQIPSIAFTEWWKPRWKQSFGL